jgi:hypothetical protein
MKHIIFAVTIFLLVFALFNNSFGNDEERTVTVTGIGENRDSAINDARRQAIESVVGVYLSSESIVENFTLLKDEIYTKTSGYITSQEILSEREEEGAYVVKLQATVGAGTIEKDLAAIGLLLQQKGNPRVMVIITEISEVSSMNPISEMAIVDYLLRKEFKVVDQEVVNLARDTEEAKAALNGDLEKAKKLGLQYSADVLIIGEAESEADRNQPHPDIGAFRGKANIKVRAVMTDTGELIATANKSTKGIDENPDDAYRKALENAGKKVARILVKKILERWESDVNNGAEIQVKVSNIDNFQALTNLEKSIRSEIRGVNSVIRRSYDKNIAILDVNYLGTAQTLSTILTNNLEVNLEVTGSSTNSIDVKLINE